MPVILIGPDRICDRNDLAKNFGVINGDAIDGAMFGDKPWTLIGNDAFMLGAVHAQKPVHLVAARQLSRAQLWNSKRHCPTILAREISILKLAGYQVEHTVDGVVFTPPKDSSQLTFSTLFKDLEASPESLLKYLEQPKASDDFKES